MNTRFLRVLLTAALLAAAAFGAPLSKKSLQAVDEWGNPVNLTTSVSAYIYEAGTTTEDDCFLDKEGTMAVTQPITYDSTNTCLDYTTGTFTWYSDSVSYKVYITDGTYIRTVDNLTGSMTRIAWPSYLTAMSGVPMLEDGWIGIGPSSERIVFDGSGDLISVNNASLVVASSAVTTGVYGSELVTNGTFTTDLTGWTGEAASAWRWQSGTADHNEASSDTTALAQNITVTSGKTYQVEFTLAGRSAGSVTVTLGSVTLVNQGATTAFSTSGTYQRSLVAGATGSVALSFTPTTTFDGNLDNITVKLVSASTALQMWNDDSSDSAIEARGDAGLDNQFIGLNAGQINTIGSGGTFTGTYAGQQNTNGRCNTFTGAYAGQSNANAGNNTFTGWSAGQSNTEGSSNVFIGRSAGQYNTSGSCNTFLGAIAGRYLAGGSSANQTSNSSVFIGYDARAAAAGQSNQIVIGNGATGAGENSATLGNTSVLNTVLRGNIRVSDPTYTGLPVNAIIIADGNEPITVTNGSGIVSKSGELYAFDAGGTDVLLTNDLESKYYDPNYGVYIPSAVIKSNKFLGIEQRIDLYKLARLVEQLTGEKVITTIPIAKADWDAEQAKLVARQQTEIDQLTATIAELTAKLAVADANEVAELTAQKDAIKVPEPYKARTKPVWISQAKAALK